MTVFMSRVHGQQRVCATAEFFPWLSECAKGVLSRLSGV